MSNWLKSPTTSEYINFDDVYKIRVYKQVMSDSSHLKIEVLFFSKNIDYKDQYTRRIENLETFFQGDYNTGLKVLKWLKEKLDISEFDDEYTSNEEIEIVIDDALMKSTIDLCMDFVYKIERLLPEGTFLNPFLQNILEDQKTVDYIIERRKSMFLSQVHKNWSLDFDLTVELNHKLGSICKTIEELGFPPRLTKDQKNVLRKIIGNEENKEDN